MAAGDDDDLPYLYDVKTGWPLGGPSDAGTAHAVEARRRRDLEAAYARFQNGDLEAFSEIVRLHSLLGHVPYELVAASETLVAAAMTESAKRARSDYHTHLGRWEAVTELLERHHEVKDRLFRVPDDCGGIRLERDDRGKNLDSAFDAVSEIFKVSRRTVEDSYYLIERGGEPVTFESFLQERRRRK